MSYVSKKTAKTALISSALVTALVLGAVGGSMVAVPGPTLARADAISAPNQQPLSFANVVEKVTPAVVSIKVKVTDSNADSQDDESNGNPFRDFPPGSPLEKFFKHFGMPNGPGKPGDRQGENKPGNKAPKDNQDEHAFNAQGSGFFISADGYVVTNNHVVDNATEVVVVMTDGSELKAKVIGTDPKTDLALVKVDSTKTFPYASFSTGNVRVGDWVVAIGNPFGLGGSVTAGIISARGRDIGAGPYDDFLQIDAPINKGNSGGPTFDLNGQVVGVNTAIYSPSGGSVGIGFAIPAQVAQKVINDIKASGKVTRGWLGVQIQSISPEIAESIGLAKPEGALVTEPLAKSPALAAGIKAGDAIIAVDGHPVASNKELSKLVANYTPNTDVKVTIWRNGASQDVTVRLGTQPATMQVASEKPATPAPVPGKLDDYGLSVAPADGNAGVVIVDIDPDGTAAARGLRTDDIIADVNGKAVTSPKELERALADAAKESKKSVLLRVKSGDQTRYIPLPLKK